MLLFSVCLWESVESSWEGETWWLGEGRFSKRAQANLSELYQRRQSQRNHRRIQTAPNWHRDHWGQVRLLNWQTSGGNGNSVDGHTGFAWAYALLKPRLGRALSYSFALSHQISMLAWGPLRKKYHASHRRGVFSKQILLFVSKNEMFFGGYSHTQKSKRRTSGKFWDGPASDWIFKEKRWRIL